jgi:hypothetical protein
MKEHRASCPLAVSATPEINSTDAAKRAKIRLMLT